MIAEVHEDIKNLIPPLSEAEYELLEESISTHGLLNSIQLGYIEEGAPFILDGHNRFEICQKLGVNCRYSKESILFGSLDEAKIWIIENQLARRIVSDFVRGELVLKKKECVQAEALRRRSSGGDQHTQNSAEAKKGETRQILAKEAGISHNTLDKIEKLTKNADSETLKLLRAKEISINKAYNRLESVETPEKMEDLKVQSIISKIKKLVDQIVQGDKIFSEDEKESIKTIISDLEDSVS